MNIEELLEKYISKVSKDTGIVDGISAIAHVGDSLSSSLNPFSFVTKPIEGAITGAIGKGGLKNEGIGILERDRNDDGSFKRGALDYIFNRDSKDIETQALANVTNSPKYEQLKKYSTDDNNYLIDPKTGRIKTSAKLEQQERRLSDPEVQGMLARGATITPNMSLQEMQQTGRVFDAQQWLKARGKDSTSTDLPTLERLKEVTTKEIQAADEKEIYLRDQGREAEEFKTDTLRTYGPNALNPDGTLKSISVLEDEEAQKDYRTKLTNKYGPNAINPDGSLKSESSLQIEAAKQDPNYLLNVAQLQQNDAISQRQSNIDLAKIDLERALGQGELDVSKLKLQMEADIANQQTQYLNEKDLRDFEYRKRQDEMNRMDDIFKIILSGANNMF